MSKQYSITYNEARRVWIASFKDVGGKWKAKWLPVSLERRHVVEAEHFFIAWYAEYLATKGIKPANHRVTPATKTLATLAPRWLEMREADPSTKPNTFNGLRSNMMNWCLDNPKFAHEKIEHLNLETDFTAPVMRAWMMSLRGMPSTNLTRVNTLSQFFYDAIREGWLDENTANPFNKPAVRKMVRDISKDKADGRQISHLTRDQVATLLGNDHRWISNYRRLRYLLAVGTGARDHEIQGLTFEDVFLDDVVPYIRIERQLDKAGLMPPAMYEDLAKAGMTKKQISTGVQAVMSRPKRNSKRALPLHPVLVEALRFWRAKGYQTHTGYPHTPVSPLIPGGRWANRASKRGPTEFCMPSSAMVFRIDLDRLQLPTTSMGKSLVFHSLRHTFSTMLADAGVDESTIGVLLGHKRQSVAGAHYIHRNLAPLAEAVSMLDLGAFRWSTR
jgi:integrase